MSDFVVIIEQSDCEVTLENKTLKIKRPDTKPKFFPIVYIGLVVVNGNPKVACNVWRELSDNGTPVVLFPTRGSGNPSWISPGLTTSVMVRAAQYHAYTQNTLVNAVGQWVLKQKLYGQKHMIEGFVTLLDDETPPAFISNASVKSKNKTRKALQGVCTS